MKLIEFDNVKSHLKDLEVYQDRVRKHKYVFPGDCITTNSELMNGIGAYTENRIEDDDRVGGEKLVRKLCSSVAGVVEKVNSVIFVRPLRNRYSGTVGDVVVGRIIGSQHLKWIIDTGHRIDSVLTCANINLASGELRIKTDEDLQELKLSLQTGDLVACEVQNIQSDGRLSLYTRSSNFGKLGQGVLVCVSPSMIASRKMHVHTLHMGVHLILGKNGWIFISLSTIKNVGGGFDNSETTIDIEEREKISRVRNCCIALSDNRVLLDEISIQSAYDISLETELSTYELLTPIHSRNLANATRRYLHTFNDYENNDY